jgi:hypothetical protein
VKERIRKDLNEYTRLGMLVGVRSEKNYKIIIYKLLVFPSRVVESSMLLIENSVCLEFCFVSDGFV